MKFMQSYVMNAGLSKQIYSKDFEQRVNNAARGFLSDLDSLLLDESPNYHRMDFTRQFDPAKWLVSTP